jgi:hypothetical protein
VLRKQYLEKKYKEVENLNKSKIAIILGTVCMLLTISIAVQMFYILRLKDRKNFIEELRNPGM